MRTPLWESSSGALATLLNSGVPLIKADLYTLVLADGTTYVWSGADVPITVNGITWQLGPGIERGRLRCSVGVAVDDMEITLTDVVGTTINGQSLTAFIRAGGMAGARMQIDRVFWSGIAPVAQPVGTLCWFTGYVTNPQGGRNGVQITVLSDMNLLNVQVPRQVYQGPCLNSVYDSGCKLQRSAFTTSSTAIGGTSASRNQFSVGISGKAAGYFDIGTITMTSGANAGISRSVKTYDVASITVLNPWPFPVVIGDTFTVVPGCDGVQSTCSSKFSNVINFRGQPYIPVPETVL